MMESGNVSGACQRPLAHKHNRPTDRRGAILLLVAVTMVALMGLLVMALDGGLLQRQKRIAQLAADAAAKAGSIEILRSRTDSVIASARSEATRNGFTHGVGGRVVLVTYPSTDATFSGPNFVQVTVTDTVRTIFGSIIGRASVPVNARAVAGVTGTTQSCITSLESTRRDAFEVDAGAEVNAVGCNISVNSNNSEALRVSGATLTAESISVTGGYYEHGSVLSPNPPTTGAAPVADPLGAYASLQVSDTSGACVGGTYGLLNITTTMTLNPGIYCGGIKVSKNTGIATLSAGLYVIKGGGLEVSAGGSLVGNNGVNIVNLNAPAANGGASKFDVINLASDATVSLTAATSGGLAGIIFYSPTLQGVASKRPYLNRVHSAADATINGSIYFPDQDIEFGSGGTLTINGGIVGALLHFASDSRVNVTGFAGGSPYAVQQASLVK